MDLQCNGGGGFLFNNVKNLEEFLTAELSHLRSCGALVVPTFITDSFENLEKFSNLVLERQKLENLYPLAAIHLEGFFISNYGSHQWWHLKNITLENMDGFYNALKNLRNLKIILTFAPELLLKDFVLEDNKISFKDNTPEEVENKLSLLKTLMDGLRQNGVELLLFCGHSRIREEDIQRLWPLLEEKNIRISAITHLHNAIYGGHFTAKDDMLHHLINNSSAVDYVELIADGHHTNRGELLPTLLALWDKIILISDASSAACCGKVKNGSLFQLGSSIDIYSKNPQELAKVCFIDFFREDDGGARLKKHLENYSNREDKLKEIERLSRKLDTRFGYENLAGSAVSLGQCVGYLESLRRNKKILQKELWKTIENPLAFECFMGAVEKLRIKGVIDNKLYRKLQHRDINIMLNALKKLLTRLLSSKSLTEMSLTRPAKLLRIEQLELKSRELHYNGKIYNIDSIAGGHAVNRENLAMDFRKQLEGILDRLKM